MSEHGQDRPTGERPMSKSEKRAAAKAAAVKAAEARKRRQALIGAFAGVAVVAAIAVAFVFFGEGSDSPKEQAGQTPSAAAPTAPEAEATAPAAPSALPQGADPALGSKPKVTAGTGQLTKLKVTEMIKGTGAAVKSGQEITVNYVGVLYGSGQEFDASWKRGQPASFAIGVGQVIPGWDQGLVGVKVGSRVQLDIPAELAYGANPGGGRPAGPLRFVVDVLAAR